MTLRGNNLFIKMGKCEATGLMWFSMTELPIETERKKEDNFQFIRD